MGKESANLNSHVLIVIYSEMAVNRFLSLIINCNNNVKLLRQYCLNT